MKRLVLIGALMTALVPVALAADAMTPLAPPAGAYKLDKTHASVTFKVNHLGFSNYTGRFTSFDASMTFDPAKPEAMTVEATIDAKSLNIPAPPDGFVDELIGKDWLDTAKYPTITFKSTKVVVTGKDTADVTGDFTLHGVTKPATLKVKFNGGYAGHPMDPNGRIGFSATTAISRSAHGIAYGVPAPGTTMGVGDAVQVEIEAEFSGPPLAGAAPTPPPPG